jgi:SWI/SNF-related matrix-associated actin-dependent regulator 1 of chromatin subfamily A
MFFSAESVNSPKLAHFSYRDVVQSKLDNLGQMLDGQENALDVASSHMMSSPTKPRNSPTKQQTLEPFLKRCKRLDDDTEEHQPMPKVPRF